ncbi:MAG: twin-arginine translocation signal domain-containing protein [Alphaproteobacteria bacterium]|nr:MAG: twin-arginine translocation signal domain-containing protein [Alphaproteobacteria bacterium]
MTRDDGKLQRTRRRFLAETAALAGAAGIALPLAVEQTSATPESMRAAIKNIVGEAPLNKGKVKLDVPALIELGPRAGRASFSTRIRLADTQKIVAVAQMSDGSFWTDEVEVVVTLAACLEGS